MGNDRQRPVPHDLLFRIAALLAKLFAQAFAFGFRKLTIVAPVIFIVPFVFVVTILTAATAVIPIVALAFVIRIA